MRLLLLLLAACAPVSDGDDTGDTDPVDSGDTDTDEPAPSLQRRLGVCDVHDVDVLGADELVDDGTSLDEAASLGLGLVRPHRPLGHVFSWNVVTGPAHDGPDDWTLPDVAVAEAAARGLQIVATVYPQAKMSAPEPGDRPPHPEVAPADLPAWAAFVGRMAERYDGDGVDDAPGLGGVVAAWEIGNEPVCPASDAACGDAYIALLTASANAIHDADPSAVVLPAGAPPIVVPDGSGGHEPLVPALHVRLLEELGPDVIDGVSIHTITGMAEPSIDAWIAAWKPVAGSLPIWLTETGSRSVGDGQVVGGGGEGEATWADAHLAGAFEGGIERVLWCRTKAPLARAPDVAEVLRAWAAALATES